MQERQKQLYLLVIGLAFVVIGAYMIYPVSKSIKLGLDLQGGASVIMKGVGSAKAPITKESMDQAESIIRSRVDRLGVAEPGIIRQSLQGDEYIQVQLPGIKDPDKALEIIGQTALLEFREVLETEVIGGKKLKETKNPTGEAEVVLVDKEKKNRYRLGPTLLTGGALTSAQVGYDNLSRPEVNIIFSETGGQQFDAAGEKAFHKQLAIILDNVVQSAPVIQPESDKFSSFNGQAVISGGESGFTAEEAKNLALVLQTGALPVKLEMSDTQVVGPTLGLDSLRAGVMALLVGFVLVIIYFIVYYRGLGVLATLVLAAFAAILFGVVAFFGRYGDSFGLYWNLTLPGLAGIVLSIGVAADSSIVIFERIKEEVAEGKTYRIATADGFKHGFLTMIDANFVTFITAFVLYLLSVGPVRGFAFTLILGVVVDLFVTYFMLQPLLYFVMNWKPMQKRALSGMKGVA